MTVLQHVDEISSSPNPVATIGTFDGIHLGHQKLIRLLAEKKKQYHGSSYVITFEPHPQLVLKTKSKPIAILTTLEEKIEILQQFDVDYLLVLPFTNELAQLSGESYIKSFLCQRLGLVDVVIGYDHSFGYHRSGNMKLLQRLAEECHFQVDVVEPFVLAGQPVKSRSIREMIDLGQVDLAQQFLGRPYQLSGWVIAGEGRGRKINFPTANLQANHPHKLIPGDGIYAVQVVVDGKKYNGAVSIGFRPTFASTNKTIEANIFDFDGDLYGQTITLQFIQRLRDEVKFSSVDQLISQMQNDVQLAQQILNQRKNILEETCP